MLDNHQVFAEMDYAIMTQADAFVYLTTMGKDARFQHLAMSRYSHAAGRDLATEALVSVAVTSHILDSSAQISISALRLMEHVKMVVSAMLPQEIVTVLAQMILYLARHVRCEQIVTILVVRTVATAILMASVSAILHFMEHSAILLTPPKATCSVPKMKIAPMAPATLPLALVLVKKHLVMECYARFSTIALTSRCGTLLLHA